MTCSECLHYEVCYKHCKLQSLEGCSTCMFKSCVACELYEPKSNEQSNRQSGRWATDEEDIYWGNSLKRKYCTNCGKRPLYDKEKREFILTSYCPHCGAKMDGGN